MPDLTYSFTVKKMTKEQLSICIISLNAYGVLAGVDTGHAGGIEVQTPLMAKWLAKHGYDISIVTWDEGIQDSGIIDGVRSLKICKRDDGIRVIRFINPRWTSLVKALNKANADIYYYNCADLGLGQLVAWAEFNKKKVIYTVANERDCHQDLSHLDSLRDRYMYKYGLKRVDKIITQTVAQKELLKKEYGLDSEMVPMPCEGFERYINTSEKRLDVKTPRILWVGRLTTVKRIEWLLDIAEVCQDLCFDVIGAENQPSKYALDAVERAKQLNNVNLHGRIKHKDIGKYYYDAALLCSTAIYEGFPNVYLEAWSTALPIVSTFDPDGVIQKNNIGLVADNKDALIKSIRSMLEKEKHASSSQAARNYFVNNHLVDSSMKMFDKQFKELYEKK